MASAHFAELRAFAETLSHEELIQQLVTMEGHKTENKKISQQRDRLLRKNKRQAKEIEELKADKKKVFYYDGFLTKMFDEDENGEWSEWTDFVEKQSFEDGKKLFGFEGDSDDE